MSAIGCAIVTDGIIDTRTVSETRRAAIVNWLVVERSRLILRTTTDEEIEDLWKFEAASVLPHATVATVEIRIKNESPSATPG